jgi:hypothetical protein
MRSATEIAAGRQCQSSAVADELTEYYGVRVGGHLKPAVSSGRDFNRCFGHAEL